MQSTYKDNLYAYFACRPFVSKKNVKTAEPIGSKFCVGPDMTSGEVYEASKLRKKNPGK